MRNALICSAVLALATPAVAQDVYFSEIRLDQSGEDIDEFVELRGTPSTSLDDLTLVVLGDSADGSGVVEEALDLEGMLTAGGYAVFAEATFTLGTAHVTVEMNLENSQNSTYLLVTGFTGALNDDLDTDDDGTLDTLPWTTIVDLVAIIDEENPPVETVYHYGPDALCVAGDTCGIVGPTVEGFMPGHVFRCPDDLGDWRIGAYDASLGVDTPNDVNDCDFTPPDPPAGDAGGDGGDEVGVPDLGPDVDDGDTAPDMLPPDLDPDSDRPDEDVTQPDTTGPDTTDDETGRRFDDTGRSGGTGSSSSGDSDRGCSVVGEANPRPWFVLGLALVLGISRRRR